MISWIVFPVAITDLLQPSTITKYGYVQRVFVECTLQSHGYCPIVLFSCFDGYLQSVSWSFLCSLIDVSFLAQLVSIVLCIATPLGVFLHWFEKLSFVSCKIFLP